MTRLLSALLLACCLVAAGVPETRAQFGSTAGISRMAEEIPTESHWRKGRFHGWKTFRVSGSTEATLDALKTLHEQGVLTDEEYEGKRQKLLDAQSKRTKGAGSLEPADVAAALAGLKLMHEQGLLTDEEYMLKQREVINAHTEKVRVGLGAPSAAIATTTGKTTVADEPGRLRIAVLPIAHHTTMAYSRVDEILYNHIARLISSTADLTLVFSEYDPRFKPGSAGGGATLWSSSFTNKTPIEHQAFAGAKRVGANVVVMIAHTKRSAGWYGDDFIFDIYLFDLEKGTKIHRKGDELNFERVIDSAFKDLVKNRS